MTRLFAISLSALFFAAFGYAAQHKKNTETIQFAPAESGIVKLMTFNIRVDTIIDGFNRWDNRKKAVYKTLQENAPDVIGLQEALNKQVEDIDNAVPEYDSYAAGRKDGKKKGETCAILYRKDRFALKDSGTFWFSDNPEKPGSKDWGNAWPRICTWVHLAEKNTGKGFYVYNVHLDVFSQNSRKKSLELLAKNIAARNTKDPFIVMGDFNMSLDNPAMAYLTKIGMTDAWQMANPGKSATGTHHGFKGRPSGDKIDHIPVSSGALALEAYIDQREVNGRYPSDHFPVVAKISLANTGG